MRCRKEEPPRRTAILQKGRPENIVNSKYNRTTIGVNTPIKAQGKIIGLLQDHTFIKRVQGSKHMLRKPPGWCISKQAFIEEVMPRTEKITVEDVESGRCYECRTEVFAENAFEIQRGNFEPQLVLVLRFWEVRSNGNRQLSLWEGGDNGL
jgi:hypothetical protein